MEIEKECNDKICDTCRFCDTDDNLDGCCQNIQSSNYEYDLSFITSCNNYEPEGN